MSSSGKRRSGSVGLNHSFRRLVWPLFPQLGASTQTRGDTIKQAEEAGLVFAFRSRCLAIAAVAAAILLVVSWPRNLYYLGFVAAFFLSGYVPFQLRHRRHAESIKLTFVVMDVALITAMVLNFPSGGVSIDWPIQTRLRTQNFLFMLLLLGEAALTYSVRRVVWTGTSIVALWSFAVLLLYGLPDTKGLGDMALQRTDAELLSMFLHPTYVSMPQWSTQVAATAFLTALIATAVHRSRSHLLDQVKAEVLRSELARYVSPDIADALARRPSAEFGAPATREVAVLFADIIGFTKLNERLSPESTFALLRSFQERSTVVVFRHDGTLDKYLGDGFMATFGALHEEPDAAARALACSFELLAEISQWSKERGATGAEGIAIAIGLHYGAVVAGNVGATDQRIEFTVVGDVVNVASRLEEATRELGCALAVSDDCVRAAAASGYKPSFDRTLDLTIRGRSAPVTVHVAAPLAQ